jgi:Xaa-Pro aminopeptidase
MPEGTLGSRVDCVARLPLWQAGLDYNHGTGHGVGSFLNVHEGPQGIGFRKKENEVVSALLRTPTTIQAHGPVRGVLLTCVVLFSGTIQGYMAGMTTSNEPGYYEDGNFGIRIENLCITVVKQTEHNFLNKRYVGFETVTMSPIATNLIQLSQLTDQEVAWLNGYHAKVRALLMPHMQETFPEAVAYLLERTEPVTNTV